MTAKPKKPDKTPDLDVILPTPETLEINGIPAVVKRLRARQFLRLMRVLTRAFGNGVQNVDLSGKDDDEIRGKVLAMFMVAIPEAIDEFAEFLMSVVEAKDPSRQGALAAYMADPDIEVLVDVFAIVAAQEKDDLTALVGKARAALAQIKTLYN